MQDNLSSYNWAWTQQGLSQPVVYFRDKIPLQSVGIWPRAGNTTPLEVVYAAKVPQLLGLADGFPLPDPFTMYPLFRCLSFAYSKDGEMQNPGLAKYWAQRYDIGVKVSNMFLAAMSGSESELAS